MSLPYRLLRRANPRLFFNSMLYKCAPSADYILCSSQSIEKYSFVHLTQFSSLASCNSDISCWKCGSRERKSTFFCKECSALQKPESTYNFFQLLRVNQSFDINAQELSQKFRHLQAQLHPDKFSNASEVEQSFSADLSSLVNKAFKVLLDPLERGIYLLSLAGHEVREENTSFDKVFLLEIMELNEELECITSISQIKEFRSKNKHTLDTIIRKVSVSFEKGDFTSAKSALMEMKYYTTLEDKIKEREIFIESQ